MPGVVFRWRLRAYASILQAASELASGERQEGLRLLAAELDGIAERR